MKKNREQRVGKRIRKLEKHLNRRVGSNQVFKDTDTTAIKALQRFKSMT